MSTEENKEIVRRYQEAYNTANFDALDEVVAADVLTPNMISSVPRGLEVRSLCIRKRCLACPIITPRLKI